MVRSTNSGVKKATKGSICTPFQRDEALCNMTYRLDRTSLDTDIQLYVTSPDKLFVSHNVMQFQSLTPARPSISITRTPPKPPGRSSDALVGGSRARIAFNRAPPSQ